ncbi:protoporphyrinogen oxidase, partial [Fusarium bulbicola]
MVTNGEHRSSQFGFIQVLSSDPNNTVIGLVRNKVASDKKLAEELGSPNNVYTLEADITNYHALKDGVEAVSEIAGGSLDFIIANAGLIPLWSQWDAVDAVAKDPEHLVKDLGNSFNVNVIGNFHLFNLFIPLVLKGQGKKVIAISSGMSDIDFIRQFEIEPDPAYTISKASTSVLTAKFAARYAREGVLFMSICPGSVDSGFEGELTEEQKEKVDRLGRKFVDYAPDFKGPSAPVDSAKAVLKVALIVYPSILKMALENLAPELVSLILQNVDSPRGLHDMISASPLCLRVFSETPQAFLSSVIRNALPTVNWEHLLALLQSPSPATKITVPEFLENYFDPSWSFDFPTGKAELMLLCRLYNRVTFLISCYTEYMYRLGFVDSILIPTSTECIRLQRAFLRFEIYCRVFPADNSFPIETVSANDEFSSMEQFDLFISRISPWEVEEIACVELYVTLMIRDYIDELESQFMSTVDNYARHAWLLLSEPESEAEKESKNKVERQLERDSLVELTALDQTSLSLFSKEDFIYDLCTAGKGRSELIRSNCQYSREFLPEALRYSPTWTPDHQCEETATLKNDSLRSNLGYLIFNTVEGGEIMYKPITTTGGRYSGVRQLGYVFWDSERILSPEIYDKLEDMKCMLWQDITFRFDPGAQKGAGERLERVK